MSGREDDGNSLPVWAQAHRGFFWYDMPGSTVEDQKLNFFLFRRGELTLEECKLEVEMQDGGTEVQTRLVREGDKAAKKRLRRTRRAGSWAAGAWSAREEAARRRRAAQKEGRKPVPLDEEQLKLRARYRALSDRLNRMDRPRLFVISQVREQGMREGPLVCGLEKDLRWTAGQRVIISRALDALEARVVWAEALRARLVVAVRAYFGPSARGDLKSLRLCQAAGVSDTVLQTFRTGKHRTCLHMMEKLAEGLRKLGVNVEKAESGKLKAEMEGRAA